MENRKSPYFYTDYVFPDNIKIIDELGENVAMMDIILFIIPNQFIWASISWLQQNLKDGVILINLSKWINNQTLETVSDTLKRSITQKSYYYAVLSGWMIASELYNDMPLGADIWTSSEDIIPTLMRLFYSQSLDINIVSDYKKVELFGAFKNIAALYTWYYEWKWLSYSSIGFYLCRLLRELEFLVWHMSGDLRTSSFPDYSYGGDIIATCFGNSRNRYLGKLVGSWMPILDALTQLKSENKHAEWYETLKWVKKYIDNHAIDCPELRKTSLLFSI